MKKEKRSILLIGLAVVIFATAVCVWYCTSRPFLPETKTIERDVLGIYMFRDSEEVMRPCFILYKDGTFSMTFSAVSSYIGIGTYENENGRLTLRTHDGDFVYCFDAVDDTYVFDAEASSDIVWFSDMHDGCVFY
ncbi:MAG: hypothetical protein E7658_10045 [Ruminococcaceae bacterium]|nr:hypothetical protein [Oscillospiraceae bacterium]